MHSREQDRGAHTGEPRRPRSAQLDRTSEPLQAGTLDGDWTQIGQLTEPAVYRETAERELAGAESKGRHLPLEPPSTLVAQVEAMLFVSDEGLSEQRMASAAAVPVEAVLAALQGLDEQLQARAGGLALRRLSTGWRLTTAANCAAVLERLVVEGQSGRLSPAALETLAVVAYRQPVSRGRIAAIRGVAVDGVVRTLTARGLIEEVGTESSGAMLYGVTNLFLDKLGLETLTELPALAPLLPDIETIDMRDDQQPLAH